MKKDPRVIIFSTQREVRRREILLKVGIANSNRALERELRSNRDYMKFIHKDVKNNEDGN